MNRRRDLAFLAFGGFVVTLLLTRAFVYLAFRLAWMPRGVLRSAYLSGFSLLALSALGALLTFRPGTRRLVALAYGVACALIFNELGVTLARRAAPGSQVHRRCRPNTGRDRGWKT